ncbi:MAG: UbiA family prenyltransferase [Halioglobus sp.]|nr:UbiA family prenyltransferase [Halioglobus sp.]
MADNEREPQTDTVPLCVDLDGTLVNTDTLVESALLLLKKNPAYLLLMLYWLCKGKAHLKEQLALRTSLDAATLPYNAPLLEWLRGEREKGRELVLVTAANVRIADAIAGHLQIFSATIASTAGTNRSAAAKRDALLERYGEGGFDYAANSSDDIVVWQKSRRAIPVNTPPRVRSLIPPDTDIEREFPSANHAYRALLKAMRPHQWVKNILVFVSLFLAHQYTDTALLAKTVLAFASFCICSSSVYLINDLVDLPVDRRNPDKNSRPFASGTASLLHGLLAIPMLLSVAFLLAATVGVMFFQILLAYFFVTLSYSFYLKQHVLFDVLTLAGLYTIRIIAGASVADEIPSVWLVSFSMFVFTSLAMAKRYAELRALQDTSGSWIGGRGYHVNDIAIISQLGTASGFISALVLALYIDSSVVDEIYSNPWALWLLCPLLMYWVGRIWLVANRGELRHDPVIYATRDPVSYIAMLAGAAILWLAL